jgi:hypothetical protein
MRFLKIASMLAVALLLSTYVSAQDCDNVNNPDGYYTTSGELLAGRVSEANCAGMGPGYPGNTQDAMSWDGTTLMTQWHV